MVALKFNIIFLLFVIHSVRSKRSFTLVLDTTVSMREEVDIIKENMHIALEGQNVDLEYILLPFGDPDVGPAIKSASVGRFLSLLDLVEVNGGDNCPEKSLTAIEMALQNSQPNSYIFVFTDGQAKDADKLNDIEALCKEHQSRVFIFLSDKCTPSDSVKVFEDVARACSGTFYYLELSSLRRAFPYIREVMKVDWTQVVHREEFQESTRFTLTVNKYTTDVLVGISGEYPELQILDNFEHYGMEQIIKSKHASVVRIIQVAVGDYILEAQSQGNALITILTHQELQFKFGFSPRVPRSLNETSDRPIPGTTSHILIVLPDPSVDLRSVELHLVKTSDKETLIIEVIDASKGIYVTKHLFEPAKPFKLYASGFVEPSLSITGVTQTLEPQQLGHIVNWMTPKVENLDPTTSLIDFGANVTFACKINSFPAPNVWWEDDQGLNISSDTFLLQIPSTYMSYARIDNATGNGTLTCTAKNTLGEDSASVEVYVNRTFTFEVIQYPSDITAEYGEEAKLYCQIEAYPEVEIKWYHNGTEIISNDEIEILSDDHILFIKEMDVHHAGEYVCEVKSDVEFERFSATVYITGLDPPEVNLQATEIVLKPGDWMEQTCNVVKGKPTPTMSWKYRVHRDYVYSDVPEGIYVEGDMIKIPSAQTYHAGLYTCEATNALGVDSQDVLVKIQYPPKIRDKDEQLIANQGDLVELPCNVDAVPYAEVTWDMYQNNVRVKFDSSHYTDDSNRHRFIAKYSDSGVYQCTAKNSMGKAIRTVNVNVWVPPYIEPPVTKNITVSKGSNIDLDCFISYGNPVPLSRWEFISVNTYITVLKTGNLTGNLGYSLKTITKKQKGTYRCVAENDIGLDTISIYLDVV